MTLMSNWHWNDERRLFSCLSFLRGINFAAFNLKLSSLLLHSSLLCQLTLTDIFKIRLPFILFYEQLWHECILLKKHLLTIQESVVGRIPEIRWGLTWTCRWIWRQGQEWRIATDIERYWSQNQRHRLGDWNIVTHKLRELKEFQWIHGIVQHPPPPPAMTMTSPCWFFFPASTRFEKRITNQTNVNVTTTKLLFISFMMQIWTKGWSRDLQQDLDTRDYTRQVGLWTNRRRDEKVESKKSQDEVVVESQAGFIVTSNAKI